MWKAVNLLLAFLVELVALGIFAWWGWATGGTTPVRLLLAIGLPVLTAVLWGLFAAPTASRGQVPRWTVPAPCRVKARSSRGVVPWKSSMKMPLMTPTVCPR